MRSKFALAGHPLHPLLVALPIGLFAWTLVSNVVYATDKAGRPEWFDIAFWSGIAAIVTALLAALPGFGDYLTLAARSDARGIATAHMGLNLATVALFIVAAVLTAADSGAAGGRFTAAVILQAVGVGLLTLSGWLGGEMVFRHHLAMVPDDSELERAEQAHHELRPGLRPRS